MSDLDADVAALGAPPARPDHVLVRFVFFLYHYRFRAPFEQGDGWWVRDERDEYLRPLSLHDPELRAFVRSRGWQ